MERFFATLPLGFFLRRFVPITVVMSRTRTSEMCPRGEPTGMSPKDAHGEKSPHREDDQEATKQRFHGAFLSWDRRVSRRTESSGSGWISWRVIADISDITRVSVVTDRPFGRRPMP
jgi:hypothetical protein